MSANNDAASSSTTTTTTTTTTLLLIDVQNDFHPGGSLAIPTANEDAQRIAQLIRQHGSNSIHRIVATLDTHQKLHIAHGCFWQKGDNNNSATGDDEHPPPFTIISSQDLENGVWKPRSDLMLPENLSEMLDPSVFSNIETVLKEDGKSLDLTKYVLEYTRRLEQRGRFQLCIWPEHCLIGTNGHAMVDNIQQALQEWSCATGRSVEWIYKGQNLLTEMYSAMQADVPVTHDTNWNTTLLDSLLTSAKTNNANHNHRLLICGQAMSHCVNYTVRDLVRHWPAERLSEICLLQDCASAVPGFEAAAQQFQDDMAAAGIQSTTAAQVFASSSSSSS
jgi:nicotinamidase/pyrazinamidase